MKILLKLIFENVKQTLSLNDSKCYFNNSGVFVKGDYWEGYDIIGELYGGQNT